MQRTIVLLNWYTPRVWRVVCLDRPQLAMMASAGSLSSGCHPLFAERQSLTMAITDKNGNSWTALNLVLVILQIVSILKALNQKSTFRKSKSKWVQRPLMHLLSLVFLKTHLPCKNFNREVHFASLKADFLFWLWNSLVFCNTSAKPIAFSNHSSCDQQTG